MSALLNALLFLFGRAPEIWGTMACSTSRHRVLWQAAMRFANTPRPIPRPSHVLGNLCRPMCRVAPRHISNWHASFGFPCNTVRSKRAQLVWTNLAPHKMVGFTLAFPKNQPEGGSFKKSQFLGHDSGHRRLGHNGGDCLSGFVGGWDE